MSRRWHRSPGSPRPQEQLQEARCHRSRRKSSNGCHCEFMTFLPACRSMTCGPSICRGCAPASRSMSSCGPQARVRLCHRRSCALLNIRFAVGRLFGWDREPDATVRETFATRLTAADLSKSLAPAGAREGPFRIVYRFENEQLLELMNRTAHAAALSALVEAANAYCFYFGVYVRKVSRLTSVYMALIDPFRKLIVYPSLLRSVRSTWNQTFGTA